MREFKRAACRQKPSDSFSLVELLVVMAIIAILASLILAAGTAVINTGMRSRAKTEIQAMSTALEGYKNDNGIYPTSDGTLLTNVYATYDGTTSNYQTNGTVLYTSLSGQSSFTGTFTPGTKVYMSFKANQVGNLGGAFSYVMDPWTHSYGYSTTTGTATTPYNGSGFFDLWSTAGITETQVGANTALTNTWLSNWTQ